MPASPGVLQGSRYIKRTHFGRSLALDLYRDAESAVRPYDVGVALWANEKPWAQVPAHGMVGVYRSQAIDPGSPLLKGLP